MRDSPELEGPQRIDWIGLRKVYFEYLLSMEKERSDQYWSERTFLVHSYLLSQTSSNQKDQKLHLLLVMEGGWGWEAGWTGRRALPGSLAGFPLLPSTDEGREKLLTKMNFGILINTLHQSPFHPHEFALFCFVLMWRKEFLSGNNLKGEVPALNYIQEDKRRKAP